MSSATPMKTPSPEAAKAAALQAILAQCARPVPVITDREQASHFHNLAVSYVHSAIVRRRWLRALAAESRGIGSFFADLWTPERAACVKAYHDLARHHRALARAEVGARMGRAAA